MSTKRRCSFRLDDSMGELTAGSQKEADNLEAGLLLNEPNTGPSSVPATNATLGTPSVVGAALEQRPSVTFKCANKRMDKSLSLTSNLSNSSTQYSRQSCFERLLIKCNYFVFGPDDNSMFVWLVVLNVCVLYNIWLIIARQSFEKLQIEYQHYWRMADAVADSLYLIDVVIQFRTGYLEQGFFKYSFKFF